MCELWYGYASKSIKANSKRCFDLITILTNNDKQTCNTISYTLCQAANHRGNLDIR